MERNKVGEIQKNYNKQKTKMVQVGENTSYVEKMKEIQNREVENNKAKLHIEHLREEMESISDFEVKEEYQKQIKEAEDSLQEGMDSLEKLEQEKESMVINKKKEERDARKAIYDKVNELQDATRKEFMAEKKEIEVEIQKNQIEYEMLKLELSQFQYQYDENGNPTNGEDFRKMQEKQGDLMAQKRGLEEMSQMCDTYRNELIAPYQMPAELPDDKIYIGYYKAKTEQEKILEEMVVGREKREQERYDETIREAMEEERRKAEQEKQDEQDEILEEMVAGREKREQERYDETIREAMEEEKRKEEQQEQEEQEWKNEWEKNQKVKVILAVSNNKIDIQGKENELFYKEEIKRAKELGKEYNIKDKFDKKSAKKIDWALVSTLENIDSSRTLIMDYLSVIKGESLNGKDLTTSLEELNKKVDIEYVFDDKEIGLLNRKAKACARKANELGIASLVGINERSLFDRMKEGITNRFKNRKLFKKKDEIKQLDKSFAEKDKEKTIKVIEQFRGEYKEEQYGKMVNGNYMKTLDKEFEKAKEERMGQYRVNNTTNQFEKNAMKAMEEQQQEIASEIEKMKPDAVIEKNESEIIL